MAGVVKHIPEGHHTVAPYLVVKGASEAIAFYVKAFGATEISRMAGPDDRIGHAELKLGDSFLYLSDEYPDYGAVSPATLGGSPVTMHMYVEDVDAVFERAVSAGATAKMPPTDAFWGDRYSKLQDPFGHNWSIATHREDLSDAEIAERAAKAMCGSA